MLVLSRKIQPGEDEIIIGGTVRVVITAIKGDKVKIGIDAPQHIEVHRREIWEQIYGPWEGEGR